MTKPDKRFNLGDIKDNWGNRSMSPEHTRRRSIVGGLAVLLAGVASGAGLTFAGPSISSAASDMQQALHREVAYCAPIDPSSDGKSGVSPMDVAKAGQLVGVNYIVSDGTLYPTIADEKKAAQANNIDDPTICTYTVNNTVEGAPIVRSGVPEGKVLTNNTGSVVAVENPKK